MEKWKFSYGQKQKRSPYLHSPLPPRSSNAKLWTDKWMPGSPPSLSHLPRAHGAPAFIVYRNGTPRIAIDYCKLTNELPIPDEFPLPSKMIFDRRSRAAIDLHLKCIGRVPSNHDSARGSTEDGLPDSPQTTRIQLHAFLSKFRSHVVIPLNRHRKQ